MSTWPARRLVEPAHQVDDGALARCPSRPTRAMVWPGSTFKLKSRSTVLRLFCRRTCTSRNIRRRPRMGGPVPAPWRRKRVAVFARWPPRGCLRYPAGCPAVSMHALGRWPVRICISARMRASCWMRLKQLRRIADEGRHACRSHNALRRTPGSPPRLNASAVQMLPSAMTSGIEHARCSKAERACWHVRMAPVMLPELAQALASSRIEALCGGGAHDALVERACDARCSCGARRAAYLRIRCVGKTAHSAARTGVMHSTSRPQLPCSWLSVSTATMAPTMRTRPPTSGPPALQAIISDSRAISLTMRAISQPTGGACRSKLNESCLEPVKRMPCRMS